MANNELYRVAEDGTVIWSVWSSAANFSNTLEFGPDGNIYSLRDGTSRIARLDAADGTVTWSGQLWGQYSTSTPRSLAFTGPLG